MSETAERQGTSGWIILASVFIVAGSISHISTGLTFVLNTRWAVEMTDYTSESTVTLIGWINLGVGALMIAAAWAVLSARIWARVVGGILGAVTIGNGIQNLSLNVFWGVVGIIIGAATIFAVSVKGSIVAKDAKLLGTTEGRPLAADIPSEQDDGTKDF
ncbi:MAG: hypothetical protein BMS9Abin07_1997 [Acidimicrobiia bacterium]|nr:MAG: hypothetical protein BMS9Abin07_1997 [Acidimicrobiia bacterium]